MSRLSPSQLQAALDSLTKANNRAQLAREKVINHCQAVYGVEPGDIDNDLSLMRVTVPAVNLLA